jgi:cation diffusion facilitator CzcD-associated flavoprotein CzcO
VGGGAAGLAAARELLAAGHRVTVLERSARGIGGVWAYTDEVEDHPLGLGSTHVHGSMYAQLRTNLPRETMGFSGFPFDAEFPGSRDPRQYCSHEEVQRYLEAFAEEFGLLQHVRFGTEVQRLQPVQAAAAAAAGASGEAGGSSDASGSASSSGSAAPDGWLRWEVTTQPAQQGQQHQQGDSPSASPGCSGTGASSSSQQYDAVVVCNGHYSRPRLPQLPGQDCFPGLQMHSHNYRRPEAFRCVRVHACALPCLVL